ncbi:hypothetical protein MMC12_003904 [Toensbergia leucococca]|nr:hypothetical protein [Toensbergia leucococca]
MSADFWAGYISGAIAITIGNYFDILKVRLQTASHSDRAVRSESLTVLLKNPSSLIRGSAAPILGFGALSAILFVCYNRVLMHLDHSVIDPTTPTGTPLIIIWIAGAVAGLPSSILSTPVELIKCCTQLSPSEQSSWAIGKELWKQGGLRGLYLGGAVTSSRDALGWGTYFWSYELSKRCFDHAFDAERYAALKLLLSGGLAGVVSWILIFPLDVIKTRVQTQGTSSMAAEQESLLPKQGKLIVGEGVRPGALETARLLYDEGGCKSFYRGLGFCLVGGFIVNAVQLFVYERIMQAFKPM